MASSGSAPVARAISATVCCCHLPFCGRPTFSTYTLSHSPLNRRVATGGTGDLGAHRAAEGFVFQYRSVLLLPMREQRGLPGREAFEGVGRVQREVHGQRAARDRAQQAPAAPVGGADLVQVVEHAARIGVVVQQRGDHHRPARCRPRAPRGTRSRVWPPLVSMNTPRPASFRQPTSARSSSSSARREGIGMPPWPLWLGEVEVAKPTAPARMPVQHEVLHLRDLGGGGGALRRILAHHVGAHRRMADEAGDVQRHALALEHGEEFGHRLEVPARAGAQHVDRHALDLREVLQDQVAVGRAGRARW